MNEDLKNLNLTLSFAMRAVDFLMYFDQSHRNGNSRARALQREFDQRGSWKYKRYIPLLCGESIIGTHAYVFAWAVKRPLEVWASVGLGIAPRYRIESSRVDGIDIQHDIAQVIRIIRHAIAHHVDIREVGTPADLRPPISRSVGFIEFFSNRCGGMRFQTEDGFLAFMGDFMNAVSTLLHRDMKELERREPPPAVD